MTLSDVTRSAAAMGGRPGSYGRNGQRGPWCRLAVAGESAVGSGRGGGAGPRMQRRRRASSPSVTSAANRPSRCEQHSKATVIRLGGNRTTVRRRGYRVAAHYGPGSLRRGVDRPPRLLYNGVEGNVPTLRIGQLDERTVGASAPVAALFGCTCCIIRLSAATELAASSSGLMQADQHPPWGSIGWDAQESPGGLGI